jgi:hypothetical protein
LIKNPEVGFERRDSMGFEMGFEMGLSVQQKPNWFEIREFMGFEMGLSVYKKMNELERRNLMLFIFVSLGSTKIII